MRGKFRNSFEKPEPFVSRQSHGRQLDDAGHLPHVPPRPPHHDPDSELLVPAGRSQSAKVLRHLHRDGGRLSKGDAARLSFAANCFATACRDSEAGRQAVEVGHGYLCHRYHPVVVQSCNQRVVGWVEFRETHHESCELVGLVKLDPPYNLNYGFTLVFNGSPRIPPAYRTTRSSLASCRLSR